MPHNPDGPDTYTRGDVTKAAERYTDALQESWPDATVEIDYYSGTYRAMPYQIVVTLKNGRGLPRRHFKNARAAWEALHLAADTAAAVHQ